MTDMRPSRCSAPTTTRRAQPDRQAHGGPNPAMHGKHRQARGAVLDHNLAADPHHSPATPHHHQPRAARGWVGRHTAGAGRNGAGERAAPPGDHP